MSYSSTVLESVSSVTDDIVPSILYGPCNVRVQISGTAVAKVQYRTLLCISSNAAQVRVCWMLLLGIVRLEITSRAVKLPWSGLFQKQQARVPVLCESLEYNIHHPYTTCIQYKHWCGKLCHESGNTVYNEVYSITRTTV